ncbi:hypothetical protein Pla100_61200 [Neorhodopirellula pilleata]|uniref:Uncharacterized protein n=1 Tax=Neorhodopirellula pilleata TaxID=2714738 RepID=A0A5C5ZHL3_9BACT|nr:hypothetical protein Pla100_61200 [Neorhodopirellula pilleata]
MRPVRRHANQIGALGDLVCDLERDIGPGRFLGTRMPFHDIPDPPQQSLPYLSCRFIGAHAELMLHAFAAPIDLLAKLPWVLAFAVWFGERSCPCCHEIQCPQMLDTFVR